MSRRRRWPRSRLSKGGFICPCRERSPNLGTSDERRSIRSLEAHPQTTLGAVVFIIESVEFSSKTKPRAVLRGSILSDLLRVSAKETRVAACPPKLMTLR